MFIFKKKYVSYFFKEITNKDKELKKKKAKNNDFQFISIISFFSKKKSKKKQKMKQPIFNIDTIDIFKTLNATISFSCKDG